MLGCMYSIHISLQQSNMGWSFPWPKFSMTHKNRRSPARALLGTVAQLRTQLLRPSSLQRRSLIVQSCPLCSVGVRFRGQRQICWKDPQLGKPSTSPS